MDAEKGRGAEVTYAVTVSVSNSVTLTRPQHCPVGCKAAFSCSAGHALSLSPPPAGNSCLCFRECCKLHGTIAHFISCSFQLKVQPS